MTIRELIEQLEKLEREHGKNAPIICQPANDSDLRGALSTPHLYVRVVKVTQERNSGAARLVAVNTGEAPEELYPLIAAKIPGAQIAVRIW